MTRIDLRKEFADILTYGEGAGRWVVVRHFLPEKSEYWDDITKEAVGGPGYKYTDTVVESYSTMLQSSNIFRLNQGLTYEKPGMITQPAVEFYFAHDVVIDENDEIFDLDYYAAEKPVIVYDVSEEHDNYVTMKSRYKVRRVDIFRAWQGRVEYIKAIADKVISR